MSSKLMLLLAVACGFGVGNVYFPQANTPSVADAFGTGAASATVVVVAVQLGYTAGLYLVVPLSDRFSPRGLLVTLNLATGGALLLAAFAPSIRVLAAASVVIGAATVTAPIIGSVAAGLVPRGRRGATSGLLLSGSIGGMLLSRAVGGELGHRWGWQAPYLASAVLALAIAALLVFALPAQSGTSRTTYAVLLREPLRLLLREPRLRQSCLYQAVVFGGFSAVWTCIAPLVTGRTYDLGPSVVGCLALVNAATMIVTPLAGRQVDRFGADRVGRLCLAGVIVSGAVLAIAAVGGAAGFAALVLGTLLLDAAMQSGMVANQIRFFALSDEARGRRTTAYMTCAYLGGACGSWLGAQLFDRFGWIGVSALVAATGVLPLAHLARTSSIESFLLGTQQIPEIAGPQSYRRRRSAGRTLSDERVSVRHGR